MKQKLKPGWTKAMVMEKIKAGNNGTRARKEFNESNSYGNKIFCTYKADDGNKCLIGCFIPEGHDGQKFFGDVFGLMEKHPDLHEFMPIDGKYLYRFQRIHDDRFDNNIIPLHETVETWLNEFFEDGDTL